MKKKRWSDRLLLAGMVLASLRCAAQDSFHYRAQVDTPPKTDFYRIALSPELVARSKMDLSDLRILDADGQFVPYVLREGVVDTGGPVYQAIAEPMILQKDSSDRHSYVTLTWRETYQIDRLSLVISYPTLYKRDARIFSLTPNGTWIALVPITIDPRDTVFRIPPVRTQGLRIDIYNADNAPLKIIGISAKQAGIYLVTWLQAGSPYVLLTGNAKAGFPQYDLGYFTDSLTRRPRDIGISRGQETVVAAGGPATQVARSADKPGGGFLLWSVLSTVLLLLIYFSVKMVSAIGAKKAPMIVYNITSKVRWNILEGWLSWQREEQIPGVLATGSFDAYQFYRLLEQDEEEGPTFVTQYFTTSLERYQQFMIGFAPAFREADHEKWGDGSIAFHTLMASVE